MIKSLRQRREALRHTSVCALVSLWRCECRAFRLASAALSRFMSTRICCSSSLTGSYSIFFSLLLRCMTKTPRLMKGVATLSWTAATAGHNWVKYGFDVYLTQQMLRECLDWLLPHRQRFLFFISVWFHCSDGGTTTNCWT